MVLTVRSKSVSPLSRKERMVFSNIKACVCKCYCCIMKSYLFGFFRDLQKCFLTDQLFCKTHLMIAWSMPTENKQEQDFKSARTLFLGDILATRILVSMLGNAPEQRLVSTEQSTSKVINFLCLFTMMAACCWRWSLLEMVRMHFKYQNMPGSCSEEC